MRYQNLSKNLTFSQLFLGRVLHPELIFFEKIGTTGFEPATSTTPR